MDFLWRKVSEKEAETIKKEAKLILEKFSKALEKVEKEVGEFKGVQRNRQMRDESKPKSEKDFKKSFFKNAPKTEGDYILAEKGAWK